MMTGSVPSILVVSLLAVSVFGDRPRPGPLNDFVAEWRGTYYTNGNPVLGSTLSLRKQGDRFVGHWDGYQVIASSQRDNKLILHLNNSSAKYGPTPGVHHYVVECTYNPDRTLGIVYDGVDASGNRVAGVHGSTAKGDGFLKP